MIEVRKIEKGQVSSLAFSSESHEALVETDKKQEGASFVKWIRHIRPTHAHYAIYENGSLKGYYGVFRHRTTEKPMSKIALRTKRKQIPLTN